MGRIPDTDDFAGVRVSEGLPGGLLYRCTSCHLWFRFPRLPKESLNELYRRVPLQMWSSGPAPRKDWDIVSALLRERVPTGTVLDVGCFDGSFLRSLGPRYRCCGVEINAAAVSVARQRGIEVLGMDFAQIGRLAMAFDAVICLDLMEHVEDPLRLASTLAERVRPGGFLCVSTGTTDAPSWRLMGSHYWYCTLAPHISFVNPAWCRLAARALNLKIETIRRFSHAGTSPGRLAPLKDLLKNALYRLAPEAMTHLQRLWRRTRNSAPGPVPRLSSPGWSTAVDHMVVLFRKPPS